MTDTDGHGSDSGKILGLDLNQAFGFATIIAAINGFKEAVSSYEIFSNWELILFFVFFVTLRFKMFVDDYKHRFHKKDIVDITIAIVSWILFIFSASSMSKSLNMAYLWSMLALAVSGIWILYSVFKPFVIRAVYNTPLPGTAKQRQTDRAKYVQYGVFNLIYLSGLSYGYINSHPSPWNGSLECLRCIPREPLLIILILAAIQDWRMSARNRTTRLAVLSR